MTTGTFYLCWNSLKTAGENLRATQLELFDDVADLLKSVLVTVSSLYCLGYYLLRTKGGKGRKLREGVSSCMWG